MVARSTVAGHLRKGAERSRECFPRIVDGVPCADEALRSDSFFDPRFESGNHVPLRVAIEAIPAVSEAVGTDSSRAMSHTRNHEEPIEIGHRAARIACVGILPEE